MDDFIEIGAFAKPAKDQRYGNALHRERIQMKTGIDPFRLLIDRVPEDNLKKVTIGE